MVPRNQSRPIYEIRSSLPRVLRSKSCEEQVDADFTRARHRAFLHRLKARLRGDPSSTSSLSFEEIPKTLGVSNKVRIGRRVVPRERIVGSAGRYGDFDRAFLPARASVGEKWKRIDRSFHRGQELPPVMLYKVGEAYFVEDGNHRVSLARFQGVAWMDAEVVDLRSSILGVKRSAACRVCFDHAV